MLVCFQLNIHFFEICIFFFKQKTAYEMRISDWSSDVCSSDLPATAGSRFTRTSAERNGGRPRLWLQRSRTGWGFPCWLSADRQATWSHAGSSGFFPASAVTRRSRPIIPLVHGHRPLTVSARPTSRRSETQQVEPPSL